MSHFNAAFINVCDLQMWRWYSTIPAKVEYATTALVLVSSILRHVVADVALLHFQALYWHHQRTSSDGVE